MACCIASHAIQHSGAPAMTLAQTATVNLTRSQFLNEMNVPSVTRAAGLTPIEANAIVADVNNL
jgi:hypothetical protein